MDHRLFLDNEESKVAATKKPKVAFSPDEDGWVPELNEDQLKFYWDKRPYVLAFGERLSGKTHGGLHKLVRHCYQWDSALVILVVLIKTSAKAGGAWEQLLSNDEDHEGRFWGTLRYWNEHVGLRYTDEYGDDAKNKWIDIETVNGGSSSILLLSMPYGANIADRIKNMTPSYFHFEELSNTDSSVYFTKAIQQLGRRAAIPAKEQQYVGTCNPADDGEDNWVFKTFFKHEPKTPHGGPQPGYDPRGYNPYTKKREGWNNYFGVHHLRSNLNVYVEDMEAYQAKILEDAREDPTAYDRLILGRWVAKVSGNAIFKESYHQEIHLKGEKGKSGLMPIPGHPIIIGYDPGDANNARAFMQRIWWRGMWYWRLFDAIADYGEHIHYEDLLRSQYERMYYWCCRKSYDFPFVHIGDKAMFTHFNPQGSYDYLAFRQISQKLILENPKWIKLGPINMLAPDKGDGSVGERVRCVKNCLHQERLWISALAPDVDNMFKFLRKAKGPRGVEIEDKPEKTKKGHIHMFDATSYPIFYYESSPSMSMHVGETEDLECGTF